MELLTYASIAANLAAVAALVVILTSAENRRRLACWLLASAQALEELRAAKRGIHEEMRTYQRELERRWCPKPATAEMRRVMEG